MRIAKTSILLLIALAACNRPDASFDVTPVIDATPVITVTTHDEPYHQEHIQRIRIDNCDGKNPSLIVMRDLSQEETTYLVETGAGNLVAGRSTIPADLSEEVESSIDQAVPTSEISRTVGLEVDRGFVADYKLVWDDIKTKGALEITYFPQAVAKLAFTKIVGFELISNTHMLSLCLNQNSPSTSQNPGMLAITPAPTGINQSTPTIAPNFDYSVRVQTSDASSPILNAIVTIEVIGQAPLDEVTDSNGIARFFIDASRGGQPARLTVRAVGYRPYNQNIDLRQGTLPVVIPLELEH